MDVYIVQMWDGSSAPASCTVVDTLDVALAYANDDYVVGAQIFAATLVETIGDVP